MRTVIVSILTAAASIMFGVCSAFATPFVPPERVPEPVTLLFVGAGIVGVALYGSIRKRRK
jgi:hypothetical protein